MKKKDSLISIVIPVKEINDLLRQETIPRILKQTYRNFEIIILPDKKSKEKLPPAKIIPTWPKTGPADKRDLGAQKAKGEVLAFIDDDSYPAKNWLKNALKVFASQSDIAAVCGPTISAPTDELPQIVSGYVWGSSLGTRGAGYYRYMAAPRRQVDDFPTANLLVKKRDFWQTGGFNTHFWSGEDTKLCLYLTKKLGKKIIYDPQVLVYHHRRAIFLPHLRQIGRYGLHRGHFARIMPETSLRLGYLAPSIFVLGLLAGLVLVLILAKISFSLALLLLSLYLLVVLFYLLTLFLTAFRALRSQKSIKVFLLVILAIFSTHLVYGLMFIKGFFTKRLKE